MDLKAVYDAIAHSWSIFRIKPLSFVKDFLKARQGSLLVTGCGSGRHSIYASRNGFKVVGLDFSFKMIEEAVGDDNKSSYLVADVMALPFKNKVFNNSLSIAVLHHLRPAQALIALKELKRVTKSKSLISVWLHPELRGEKYVKWGRHDRFYYFYSKKGFMSLVKKVFKHIKELPDERNIVLIVS